MKKLIAVFALGFASVAVAEDELPFQMLEGSPARFDQVQVIEKRTPGTAEMLPQHYAVVRVSGMFTHGCGVNEVLVKETKVNTSRDAYSFRATMGSYPIRCMIVMIPHRLTFTLDQIYLGENEPLPSVTVNGIAARVVTE
jgi:hypothetical protein